MQVNVYLLVENVIQIKIGITVNGDVSAKIRENITCAKKIIFGILVCVLGKSGKYLGSIICDSVIRCDETMKATKTFPIKTVPKNFNETS